jgi:hypothetical protein
MTNRQFVLYAGLAVFFAGCSAGGSSSSPSAQTPFSDGAESQFRQSPNVGPSPPPQRPAPAGPGWLSTQAARGDQLIYVANDNNVVIFPKRGQDPQPIGEITKGVTYAYGLFVDAEKTLYVCNQYHSSVTVYPAGAISPTITYTKGLSRPLYAAAGPDRLFVGNGNTGKIAVFKQGDTKLLYSMKTLGAEVDGLNFDGEGNLYAAYRRSNSVNAGGVEMFPRGSRNGEDLGIKLTAPQGLVVDPSGNIVVAETQTADRIDVFPPGHTTPSQTLSVHGTPTGLALGVLEQRLYTSTLSSRVYLSGYPDIGGPVPKIDNSLSGVQGLAVSPPAEP